MNKQKVENELQKIESSVAIIRTEINSGIGTPEITFGEMKRSPINNGVMLANGNGDVIPMPYSALEFRDDGKKIMRYVWINPDKAHYLSCKSNSGEPADWHSGNTASMTGGIGYGAYSYEMFKGYYYHSHHIYPVVNDKCQSKFFRSSNGFNWTDISGLSTPIWAGEDRSFMVLNKDKANEKLLMFIRPYLPNHGDKLRHIDLWETADGLNWTFIKRLLTSEVKAIQYYSMSACQVAENQFYVCVNLYDSIYDVFKIRVYETTDIYDTNKYIFKNNIPFPTDIQMMFGAVSYDRVKKEVVLLAGESKRKHNEPPTAGKYIQIVKYSAKVEGV